MGYASQWNDRSAFVEDVLEDIKRDYPQDWQAAHNPQRGDKQQREAYCQRVCARLREMGIPAGMNGKRGNPNDLSEDIIALPHNGTDGAPDTSGRFPSIEIRDVIASAGPDNDGNQGGRPYFGDVTQATLDKREAGCYVEPTAQVAGRPPTGGTPDPPPVPDPLPPPIIHNPPPPGNTAGLEARIAALEGQNANILSGIGALATQIGTLSGNVLDPNGGFDTLTKRLFGVGTDDASIAEEVVAALTIALNDPRNGLDLGCKVHRRLRG